MKLLLLQICFSAAPFALAVLMLWWQKSGNFKGLDANNKGENDDDSGNDPDPKLPIVPHDPGTPLSEILLDRLEKPTIPNQAAVLWLSLS